MCTILQKCIGYKLNYNKYIFLCFYQEQIKMSMASSIEFRIKPRTFRCLGVKHTSTRERWACLLHGLRTYWGIGKGTRELVYCSVTDLTELILTVLGGCPKHNGNTHRFNWWTLLSEQLAIMALYGLYDFVNVFLIGTQLLECYFLIVFFVF